MPPRRPTRADPLGREIEAARRRREADPGAEPASRRPRGSSQRGGGKGRALARLKPEEGADLLRTILDRHPELVAEAEEIARSAVADVEAEAVAEDVEQAVLDLDLGELNSRAGRQEWGYVEPAEAAWEILAEAIDPFLDDVKRHIDLGFEAAAVATCAGIVLGLYRCRGKNPDQVLGWAEDFPADAAGDAVAMLASESRAKHRRAWLLPDAVVAQVPEWLEMIGRCSSASSGRR